MNPHHQAERTNQRHDSDEQIFRSVVGDFADLLEILGQSGNQMASFLIIEEAEGQLLQMVESLTAHLGLDIDAEHVSPIGHDNLKKRIEHVNPKQTYGCQ